MTATAIVEALDVRKDLAACVVSREQVEVVHELDLERCEEALRHGVVPAVALATHARNDERRAHVQRPGAQPGFGWATSGNDAERC